MVKFLANRKIQKACTVILGTFFVAACGGATPPTFEERYEEDFGKEFNLDSYALHFKMYESGHPYRLKDPDAINIRETALQFIQEASLLPYKKYHYEDLYIEDGSGKEITEDWVERYASVRAFCIQAILGYEMWEIEMGSNFSVCCFAPSMHDRQSTIIYFSEGTNKTYQEVSATLQSAEFILDGTLIA